MCAVVVTGVARSNTWRLRIAVLGGNTYAQLLGNSQRLSGYNQLEEECGK